MATHGLRTTGTHTGNFGRQKVKAGSRLNDIGVTNAEVVNITRPDDYTRRLLEALDKTEDPRLKSFIYNELRSDCIKRGIGLQRLENLERTANPYRTPGA